MPKNSEYNTPTFLANLSALPNRFGAKAKTLAVALENDRTIYAWYAISDPMITGGSVFRYSWDMFMSNIDPLQMRQLMSTPTGIILIAGETLFLITLSFVAHLFDKHKNNSKFIQCMVDASPSAREGFKGLKNGGKGIRSFDLSFAQVGLDMMATAVPVGIVLGVFTAVDRILMLKLKETRKTKMAENIKISKRLIAMKKLTAVDKEEILGKIQRQNARVKIAGFFGVTLGGSVDGLYLDIGPLGLAVLAPQLFAPILAISMVLMLLCVLMRNYENYDFELKLEISEIQAQLLVLHLELLTHYQELVIKKDSAHTTLYPDLSDMSAEDLEKKINALLPQFQNKRAFLINQSKHSYTTAALSALKDALTAYSALTSTLFLLSTILMLAGYMLPPALLVASVLVGMTLVIGYVAHAVKTQYEHVQIEKTAPAFDIQKVKDDLKSDVPRWEWFKKFMHTAMDIAPQEQSTAPEALEVVRSVSAGGGKFEKFMEFIGLEEQATLMHGSDNPFKLFIEVIGMLLLAAVMGLRGLAKGFGREQLWKIRLVEDLDTKKANPVIAPTAEPLKPQQPIRVASNPYLLLRPKANSPRPTAISPVLTGVRPRRPSQISPQIRGQQAGDGFSYNVLEQGLMKLQLRAPQHGFFPEGEELTVSTGSGKTCTV